MVMDILKFHKLAENLPDPDETVDHFVQRSQLGRRFRDDFLLPLGSALWSCSVDRFGKFPMEFVTDFLSNHQMLQANNRPIWRVIQGGSRTYVDVIVKQLGERLKLSSPIQQVRRIENGVELNFPDGTVQTFDEVILACHADQSLRLLKDPDAEEEGLLEAFPYEQNKVVLHSDDSVLPRDNLPEPVGMLIFQNRKMKMHLSAMI